jgi:hypothetical protein
MKAEPQKASLRVWEITVESDWITTVGAVLLFVICGLLLIREIRHIIWGHLSVLPHLHKGLWSIWNWVFEGIAAVYCFILAFTFPRKPVKLACALAGIYLAGPFLLSCFRLSLSVQHVARVSRSILYQFALVISCVAIADWLRSVVHRGPPSEPQGGDS